MLCLYKFFDEPEALGLYVDNYGRKAATRECMVKMGGACCESTS
jgi:hypothetical protein